ncbi:MAG TPA: type II toxin-antitoxin system VapC family toxin [Candidatus Sulfotelmatobacter sp.]
MSRVVLDASALLAILNEEPGWETVTDRLRTLDIFAMSTVNVSEAYGKLLSRGLRSEEAWRVVTAAVSEIAAFDEEQARIAGHLLPRTRSLGLSLGDRACLALAMVLKAPVYTADRVWKSLRLGVTIHVIR